MISADCILVRVLLFWVEFSEHNEHIEYVVKLTQPAELKVKD